VPLTVRVMCGPMMLCQCSVVGEAAREIDWGETQEALTPKVPTIEPRSPLARQFGLDPRWTRVKFVRNVPQPQIPSSDLTLSLTSKYQLALPDPPQSSTESPAPGLGQ
jgi:hypothetical protein